MDNGLVLDESLLFTNKMMSLNPCCSGQWSRTQAALNGKATDIKSLNPCCSGQWSRTNGEHMLIMHEQGEVLILVVVDNGLVHTSKTHRAFEAWVLILVVVDNGLVQRYEDGDRFINEVLILVVVDNGLVHSVSNDTIDALNSLNPCCSGQWSRTVSSQKYGSMAELVLILVVVDNGLVQFFLRMLFAILRLS